jgi:hypothetical protein
LQDVNDVFLLSFATDIHIDNDLTEEDKKMSVDLVKKPIEPIEPIEEFIEELIEDGYKRCSAQVGITDGAHIHNGEVINGYRYKRVATNTLQGGVCSHDECIEWFTMVLDGKDGSYNYERENDQYLSL